MLHEVVVQEQHLMQMCLHSRPPCHLSSNARTRMLVSLPGLIDMGQAAGAILGKNQSVCKSAMTPTAM